MQGPRKTQGKVEDERAGRGLSVEGLVSQPQNLDSVPDINASQPWVFHIVLGNLKNAMSTTKYG